MTVRALRGVLTIAVIVGVVCTTSQGFAKSLDCFDLDSLVYMSRHIVEGEIVEQNYTEDVPSAEFRVTAVYKGDIEKGAMIVVLGFRLYAKPTSQEERFPDTDAEIKGGRFTKPLVPGDRLILFISSQKTEAPGDRTAYDLVPSGVQLIVKDRVAGFSQYMGNPGAYVAEMDERLLEKMRTIKEFNAALRDSMTRVKQIKRNFDGNPSPQWLLDLIRQRAALDLPQRIFARDHILEIACGRLAILRDTDALMQAAELTNDWYARDALARGLGTPDGREALLSVIADTGQSTERRTLFAMLLRRVGVVYSEINADRGTPKGEPKAGNAAYMTRIAQLALDSAKREPLSLALTEAVRSGAEQCGFTEDRDLHSDCLDALELLKSLHSTTRSEEIKFAIEIATRTYSKEAYEKLESPCGPVVSIVRPPSPTQGLPPGERGLLVRYQANIWPGDEAEYETEAVFEHVASGSQFTSPCPHMGSLRNGGCGGGMAIPLPEGLAEGVCRVHLQFRRDGKVVSTGHYLETEL